MSQASKRKHVVQEVLGEHMVPSDQQQIVKVSDPGLQVSVLPIDTPIGPLGCGKGGLNGVEECLI